MNSDGGGCEAAFAGETEVFPLLEAIYRQYGFDYRNYAPASIRRRIHKFMGDERIATVAGLRANLVRDPVLFRRLALTLSVSVTSFFRDPAFYRRFREHILPGLAGLPMIRVWNAGCSSGEEAYSMAILLEEEGMLSKTRIYATDLNEDLLNAARDGIYPLEKVREHMANYKSAGLHHSFSDHYHARHGRFVMNRGLRSSIIWAQHNLVTDGSFNEFHLIMCRNVLIYFNRTLQDRVHRLIYESLAPGGVLGLGIKESLSFTPYESRYETIDGREKLYRKVG